MVRQRGSVELKAEILNALMDGPLYHSQLRQLTGIKGSTIYRHLGQLKQQRLIEDFFEPYDPRRDLHYYQLTPAGREALRYIQLTFDILGMPDLRSENR